MTDRELEITGVAADSGTVYEKPEAPLQGPPDRPQYDDVFGLAGAEKLINPFKYPTPPERDRGGPGFATPEQLERLAPQQDFAWTEDDYRQVQAHLWKNIPSLQGNEAATSPIMSQIMRVADQEFMELFWEDTNRALAMSDDEYLAAQMLDIEQNTSAGRIVGAALTAALVEHENREYPLIAAGRIADDRNLVANEFEANQVPVSDIADVMDLSGQELEDMLSSDELRDTLARDGVWKVDDNRLLVAYTDDAGTQTALIRLDPGTKVETDADALAAVALAKAGLRHTAEIDEVEGRRNVFGILLRKAGDTIRFVENATPKFITGALASDEEDLRSDADKITQAEIDNGTAAGRIYADLARDPEFAGMGAEGIWAMAEEVAASPEYAHLSSDQVYEAAKTRADEEGTWVAWLQEEAMPPIVNVLETYDKWVHQIGLGLLGQASGVAASVDADPNSTYAGAVKEALENEYVSEFFGVEAGSGWGMTMNLGASILFDPITWVTPGGKASLSWMKEVVTNPAMAKHLLRTPQFRSAIRQTVVKNDDRIAMSLVSDGFSPRDALRVLEIAAEDVPKAQRLARAKELEQMFTRNLPANGGSWIPAGPRSLVHVKNVRGMQAVVRDFKLLPKGARERFAELWVRASKDRGGGVGDDFASRALDAAITANPNDPQKVIRLWKSALDAQKQTIAGSADEIGTLTPALEAQERAYNVAKTARGADPDVAMVAEKRALLDELDALVAESDTTGKRVVADDLSDDLFAARMSSDYGVDEALDIYRMRDRLRAEVEMYGDEFDRLDAAATEAWREAKRLENEIAVLSQPKSRRVLERWWHEFYDEWADELGVPRLEGDEHVHPFLKNADGTPKQQHDWSVVTGEKSKNLWQEADEGWIAGYVGDGSDDVRRQLEALGLAPDQTVTVLPASPMEMATYKLRTPLFNDFMRNRVSPVADAVQNVFASSVLLNLNTPVKTHGDEIIRFIQDAGMSRSTLLKANLPRSVAGDVGSYARAYGREAGTPSAARMRQWQMVDPSKRGQWHAAERFVNGNMVQDEIVQRYARAVISNDRRPFTLWWNREGHQIYGTTTRGRVMTADEAYNVIDQGVQLFLKRGDEPLPKYIVDEIMDAAANGRQVDLPPRDWRQFPEVPGQLNDRNGLIDMGFELLYGGPSQRRGSVIFDHYYEMARDLHLEAAKKNGRGVIMDVSPGEEAERLVRLGYASDIDKAQDMLIQGKKNPVVADMLRAGWKLESDINAMAASYARASADSMMYTMGAVSVGGKRLARVFPWGRAQMDYIGYWSKKLTEPTQFQLQRPSLKPGQSFQQGVGKVYSPSTRGAAGGGVELNRVNLRLMDRIAHIATVGPQDGKADAPVPYSPEWAINTFTFLPSKLDEQFIVENTPSAGPVPSWLINWLPEDNPIRQAWETAVPSHEIFNNYTNTPESWINNLRFAVAPNSPRSVSTMAGNISGMLAPIIGTDNAVALYNAFTGQTEPPFFRDQLTLAWGNFLADNAFDPGAGVFKDGAAGGYADLVEQINENATRNAYSRNGWESIRKNIGLPSYLGEEALYATFYMPILDSLDQWVADGYVSEGQADSFRIAAGIVGDELAAEEGVESSLDVRARNEFADVATDILFAQIPDTELDRFVVMNPGVGVNMTSWVEVVTEDVPDKWAKYISGGKIKADGETRREMYRDGFDAGWIKARPVDEWVSDVHMALRRSARNVLKDMFENDLGMPWTSRSAAKMAIPVTIGPADWGTWQPVFDQLHMDPPDEWANGDGSYSMTVGELKDWFKQERSRFSVAFEKDAGYEPVLSVTDTGRELMALHDNAESITRDLDLDLPIELSGMSPEADQALEEMRSKFRAEVATNPDFNEGDYARWFEDSYGPLEYSAPQPPSRVADLDAAFSGPPSRFVVTDGDTIEYMGSDGVRVPFRLVGINAPESYQVGGAEATNRLQRLLDQAETVTVGMFDRERYGETQTFFTTVDGQPAKRERVFGWLYIDGEPVWFPELFGPDNERGAPLGVGGEIPDYSKWMKGEVS